jgi:steroid delta-isomerase-like uncharacterized protein
LSPETNKAIIRQMFKQVWNERRLDLIEEFYAEDVLQHILGMPIKTGLESVRDTTSMILNAYPDLLHTINDEIAEGNKVVSRWTLAGTFAGELNQLPAAGKAIIQSGVTIFHLSNARVDEFWLLSDNPEFMQLLGVVPPDEA